MTNLYEIQGLQEALEEVVEAEGLPTEQRVDAILGAVQEKLEAAETRETLSDLKAALEPLDLYPRADILKAIVEVLPVSKKPS